MSVHVDPFACIGFEVLCRIRSVYIFMQCKDCSEKVQDKKNASIKLEVKTIPLKTDKPNVMDSFAHEIQTVQSVACLHSVMNETVLDILCLASFADPFSPVENLLCVGLASQVFL